ncbi:ABC transporter permease [Aeromicrobium sp. UC242_57]|uniref:ABC transporter permease n=1 Tax=Aeromicrobium sp. UC242_57 TaxID=3374624 RepID=UPI00378A0309
MSTAAIAVDTTRPGVPLSRLVKVELRKMFNTRSGFWLMMSIAALATIATVIVLLIQVLNDNADVTYGIYSQAVGTPMAILLPVIAILSVTSEWTQRTGLITFTLAPNRAQIIWAKALSAIIVGLVSMVLAMAIGAVGYVVGTTIAGDTYDWDVTVRQFVFILIANVLGLLIGFMLGVLIRNSAAAIVGYFVYSLVIPGLLAVLAELWGWFKDVQPWIDFNYSSSKLFSDSVSGEEWAQIGTSGLIWLVIPLTLGVLAVMKSEVK